MGNKLYLLRDVKLMGRDYKRGHCFTIIGNNGMRGYDIMDEDGNKIYETGLIQKEFTDNDFMLTERRVLKINKIKQNII
jgi:hypothetical protein